MTDFVDRKVTKGQQGTSLLSNRLFDELIAVFNLKKTQIGTKFDKKPKFFQFLKSFIQMLSKFRQTSRIGMLKTVIKVSICCEVVFNEKIIAVFTLKNISNWH